MRGQVQAPDRLTPGDSKWTLFSLRQANAPQQVCEARVGAQVIKLHVHFRPLIGEIGIALGNGLFQPDKGLVFLAQDCVDTGNVIRRNLFVFTFRFQLREELNGFSTPPGEGIPLCDAPP